MNARQDDQRAQLDRAHVAADREARARQQVLALMDEWQREYGPESEAWRVFGPQVVSVPFVVAQIRAACEVAATPAHEADSGTTD